MILNILHLARTMGQGGAEKIIFQLASGCNSIENKIVVASCGGVYVDALKQKNICHYQVHDLECKNPWIILQTLVKLAKVVKKERIQMIHSHHRMAALYGRILKCFFPKLKLVYTAHNVFEDKARLTKMALSDTEIVAVGESVKNNLMEVFQIEEDRITTIFNAVDIQEEEWQHPLLQGLKEQGNTLIGIIGRLSEQKGMDLFIKAIGPLTKKYPMVKGIIVGDGEKREELQALVKQSELEASIYFLGYQEHVTAIIKQLDFAAMPSRWEGFPLTPIEIFAMEKTLVAADIGGINEIVEDGRNGLLVPKNNEKQLSEAMELLLLDIELRQQLEQQAKIDYNENYSYQSFLENYLHFYQTIKDTFL